MQAFASERVRDVRENDNGNGMHKTEICDNVMFLVPWSGYNYVYTFPHLTKKNFLSFNFFPLFLVVAVAPFWNFLRPISPLYMCLFIQKTDRQSNKNFQMRETTLFRFILRFRERWRNSRRKIESDRNKGECCVCEKNELFHLISLGIAHTTINTFTLI